MLATAQLDTIHDVDPASIYRDCTHMETLVVKDKKKLPPKKEWKNGKKPKPRRKKVKTKENRKVWEMRSNLEIINRVIQESKIELEIDQHDQDELNRQLAKDPDKYVRPVDFTQKQLYRVFLDGKLHCHGRFYGPWHVNIPEEYREKILIDGDPVKECDYGQYHPFMLYCLDDLEIPPGDLYLLPDSDPEDKPMRKLLKRLTLIMINAKTDRGAIGALIGKYEEDAKKAKRQGKPIPKPPLALTNENLNPLVAKIRERHTPIQHYFDQADIGNILMNYDSQIAERVMLHFAKKGIPALPVHDSFVVPVIYVDECWDVMLDAFQDVMMVEFSERGGQAISIDGSYGQGLMNAMKRISALDRSPEWESIESEVFLASKADDEISNR